MEDQLRSHLDTVESNVVEKHGPKMGIFPQQNSQLGKNERKGTKKTKTGGMEKTQKRLIG